MEALGPLHLGGCQNYGPLNIGCRIIYTKDPKRDHDFANHPLQKARLQVPSLPYSSHTILIRLKSLPGETYGSSM